MHQLSLDETKKVINFFIDKFEPGLDSIISDEELIYETMLSITNNGNKTKVALNLFENSKKIIYRSGGEIDIRFWYNSDSNKIVRKEYYVIYNNFKSVLHKQSFSICIRSPKTCLSYFSLIDGLIIDDNISIRNFNKENDVSLPLKIDNWTEEDVTYLRMIL